MDADKCLLLLCFRLYLLEDDVVDERRTKQAYNNLLITLILAASLSNEFLHRMPGSGYPT